MTWLAISTILLFVFGAVITAAAFNAKRLIAWENRQLTRWADKIQEYRRALEEEGQVPHDR